MPGTARVHVRSDEGVIEMVLRGAHSDIRVLFNFSEERRSYSRSSAWELVLDSSDPRWSEEAARNGDSIPAGSELAPLSCSVLRGLA
jgi:hypothetical protein